MVYSLKRIFIEMIYFMIVFLIVILAFASAFRCLSDNYEIPLTSGVFNSFVYSYMMANGEYPDGMTEIFDGYTWFFFFLANTIAVTIMLNLLIAITGNSFAAVQSDQVIHTYKERAEIIYDYYKLWRQTKRVPPEALSDLLFFAIKNEVIKSEKWLPEVTRKVLKEEA